MGVPNNKKSCTLWSALISSRCICIGYCIIVYLSNQILYTFTISTLSEPPITFLLELAHRLLLLYLYLISGNPFANEVTISFPVAFQTSQS